MVLQIITETTTRAVLGSHFNHSYVTQKTKKMLIGKQIKETLESLSPSKESNTVPVYDHITLTDDETKEALRLARETKHYKIEKENYFKKISSNINWHIPSSREIYEALRATVSQTGKQFVVNDGNGKAIEALCLYFAGDARFCSHGKDFSLDKGILLVGIPGVGKTHLMDFFKKNPHASYATPTCKVIAERYVQGWKRDELSTIEYYSGLQPTESAHIYDQTHLGICFGDLGAESDGNNYGNKRNVIEEIVFNRYESKLPFKYTHFTSNLNSDMIATKYGDRMRDRLREMCNYIVLGGQSFR